MMRSSPVRFLLLDHRQIEAAGDPAEQADGVAEARLEQAVLGGQPLALGDGLETIDGGLGSRAGFVALGLHPGGRQAVQDRRRDHGIESKGDTGDVGLERGCDGEGEVGGRVAVNLQGQVHHEILDQGPISRMAPIAARR
jgi:hypothetical protein